jgi:hypothetical protein
MHKSIIFAVFLILPISLWGQTVAYDLPTDLIQKSVRGEGEVVIHEETGIPFLLDTHIEMNKRHRYFDGYRIQLYSGSGQKAKHLALEVKGKILELFPDEPVYISFTAPFWRVRVGNYRNKHEALGLMSKLKKEFPDSYVVKDGSIKLDDL